MPVPSTSTSKGVDTRNEIKLLPESLENVGSTDFPGYYAGEDHTWDLNKFRKNLRLTINRKSESEIEFDLVGVDASVANAFRRILISEVPTVAIETVYIWNNTSIVQDEVLSQRLGLVPMSINPELVGWMGEGDPPTDLNTLVFELIVKYFGRTSPATKKAKVIKEQQQQSNSSTSTSASNSKSASPALGGGSSSGIGTKSTMGKGIDGKEKEEKDAADRPLENDWEWLVDEVLVENGDVLSGQLKWKPQGYQKTAHGKQIPQPVNKNILLAKLAPGQMIVSELHCRKGIAKDHAKFSPVATASYRLLPTIHITKPIPKKLQQKFVNCFPRGVCEIRKKKNSAKSKSSKSTTTTGNDEEGDTEVVVVDVRKDTVSREVLRHKEFEGMVELGRKRDHFIFSIESSGCYPPEALFTEAGKVFLNKIRKVKKGLEIMTTELRDDAIGVGDEDVEMA